MANQQKIHFIGINGIGVSALARFYLTKGAKVSGSDLASSEITDMLKKEGAEISIGEHKSSRLRQSFGGQVGGQAKLNPSTRLRVRNLPDLVIYSPAIQPNNPELTAARRLGIKTQSYPEALGELTKKYFTIAVSGTHGKSTTTAMLAKILIEAGLDPTVVVGTKLKEFSVSAEGSNFRKGNSSYLVIEADEWQASFLNYWPKIIVLTNIEQEHMDYYRDLKHILKTFREYIGHLPRDGILVANRDDINILRILNLKSKIPNPKQIPNSKFQIQNYSLNQPEAKKIREILKVPGEHNVANALAALTAARILKIPDETSFKALSNFKGTWRRFEIKEGRVAAKKFTIISDYGHHPTEVATTLRAAREKFPEKDIWCVFQPHQFQRTFYLFNDFVKIFSKALVNRSIITDIYSVAGREKGAIKRKISSKKLVKAINKKWVLYLLKNKIIKYLAANLKGKEVVIFMGAGDIYKLADSLCSVSNRVKYYA